MGAERLIGLGGVVAIAATTLFAGCMAPDQASSASCASAQAGPVAVYGVAPVFGPTWWYIGQEPAGFDMAGETEEGGAEEEPPFGGEPPPGPPFVLEPPVPGGAEEPAEPPDEGGEPGDETGDGSGDGDPPEPPPPPPPPPPGGDGSSTQSIHPLDFGATANGCFTCDVTCTTQAAGPGQPRALSTASGSSAVSQAAACADAERHLKHYASTSYGLALAACGFVPTSASPAPPLAF